MSENKLVSSSDMAEVVRSNTVNVVNGQSIQRYDGQSINLTQMPQQAASTRMYGLVQITGGVGDVYTGVDSEGPVIVFLMGALKSTTLTPGNYVMASLENS